MKMLSSLTHLEDRRESPTRVQPARPFCTPTARVKAQVELLMRGAFTDHEPFSYDARQTCIEANTLASPGSQGYGARLNGARTVSKADTLWE
jgi:hypothetical protein